MPLLAHNGCISWARARQPLSCRLRGPVLSVTVPGPSCSVLQGFQDVEQPAGLSKLCLAALGCGQWVGEAGAGEQGQDGAAAPAQLYFSFLPNELKLYFFQSCSRGQAQVVYLIISSFFFFVLVFLPLNYPPLFLAH